METTNLTIMPDVVIESAHLIAESEGETLVGWRAITKPVPGDPYRVVAFRYQVITDRGVYEVDLDGICQRASVLHKFD